MDAISTADYVAVKIKLYTDVGQKYINGLKQDNNLNII